MLNSTSSPNVTTGPPTNWPYEPIDSKQGVILLLITLPGVFGNIVAFAATVKLLKTRIIAANYLVLALTITDFYGVLLCTIPTHLCYIYFRWVGGDAMCKFQGFSSLFASLASGCLATVMAVDRLLAITMPFKYKKLVRPVRAIIGAVSIWVFSFIIAIIPLGGGGRFKRNLTGTFCTIDWFAKKPGNIAFSVFYACLGFILVGIIIYCNIKVVLGLKNISRKRRTELTGGEMRHQQLTENRKNSATNKLERQFARSVCVISVLFLICWLPFMVRVICNLASWWTDPWVDVQVSRLLLLNFVLDPFVYTFSRKQCRDIILSWFCCCFKNVRWRKAISFRDRTVAKKSNDSEQTSKLQSTTSDAVLHTGSSVDSKL